MSTPGAITAHIDVAQAVLYLFWVFFAGLIVYLQREMKREGYPLESDGRGGRVTIQGFPAMPEPKTYRLADGSSRQAPSGSAGEPQPLNADPSHPYPGSPLLPRGNPLLAGVGPGAWAQRPDVPDRTVHGLQRLVPLRQLPDHRVADQDPDPRGKAARGADGVWGGTVVDLWVDVSEALFRYLELEVAGGRHVLLPINFARITDSGVQVQALLGAQFVDIPGTRSPNAVTLLEEEKVMAYCGAGTLYATPQRAEPLI